MGSGLDMLNLGPLAGLFLQHQIGSLRQRIKSQEWSLQSVSVKIPIHDGVLLPAIHGPAVPLQAHSHDHKVPVLTFPMQDSVHRWYG